MMLKGQAMMTIDRHASCIKTRPRISPRRDSNSQIAKVGTQLVPDITRFK